MDSYSDSYSDLRSEGVVSICHAAIAIISEVIGPCSDSYTHIRVIKSCSDSDTHLSGEGVGRLKVARGEGVALPRLLPVRRLGVDPMRGLGL